jgi:hypothetical protein
MLTFVVMMPGGRRVVAIGLCLMVVVMVMVMVMVIVIALMVRAGCVAIIRREQQP